MQFYKQNAKKKMPIQLYLSRKRRRRKMIEKNKMKRQEEEETKIMNSHVMHTIK